MNHSKLWRIQPILCHLHLPVSYKAFYQNSQPESESVPGSCSTLSLTICPRTKDTCKTDTKAPLKHLVDKGFVQFTIPSNFSLIWFMWSQLWTSPSFWNVLKQSKWSPNQETGHEFLVWHMMSYCRQWIPNYAEIKALWFSVWIIYWFAPHLKKTSSLIQTLYWNIWHCRGTKHCLKNSSWLNNKCTI